MFKARDPLFVGEIYHNRPPIPPQLVAAVPNEIVKDLQSVQKSTTTNKEGWRKETHPIAHMYQTRWPSQRDLMRLL